MDDGRKGRKPRSRRPVHPQLLQLVEDASMQCLAPLMDANEISLGTHVDIAHLSATPVG